MDFSTKTSTIYTHLEDELSRDIFANRLLFSLTQDKQFIYNVTFLALSRDNNVREIIHGFFPSKDLIIYGCGNVGREIARLLDVLNITAFCDSSAEKWGREFFGHEIISPMDLAEKYPRHTIVVAVWNDYLIREITNNLYALGFAPEQVKTAKDFYEILRTVEYFDDGIILSQLSKNEVFIDAGCLDFGTSHRFIDHCGGKYKHIFAFEPNPDQYPICAENARKTQNATVYPFGLWHENTELSFDNGGTPGGAHFSCDSPENPIKVKAVRLDDILDGERVTFIKMDIEGAELHALKGATQTILAHRPKLAICVYHKTEDIWQIPLYILSLHSDYKLYLRNYSFARSPGTVLYAV